MLQPPPLDARIDDSRERLGLKRKFDLGVLLVHGIGEQTRGDVLTEEGDRIFDWLRRRVENPDGTGGDADVLDVVARQRSGDDIPASHAVVRITPPTKSDPPAHWVIAEAWWTEVFRPATFGELAGWTFTVGPWVFATQVAGILRRMEIGENVPRLFRFVLIPVTLLTGLVMLFGAAFVGFAVTALALLLFVFAIIPLPFVTEFARSLQRGLANGFGDAYVLTRSPVRFGAMATQVRSDLQVLLRECTKVAIVAHSQGTAVAWYALVHELTERPKTLPKGSREPAPIGLFVTYGQAVRKLTFVLTMARGRQSALMMVAAFGSAGLLALGLGFLLAGAPLPLVGAPMLLAVITELLLTISARPIWDEAGKDIESDWEKAIRVDPTLEWLDLWGSADPAPVGPLDVSGKGIRSYKIRNLSSVLLDHFVYWRSPTEFIAIVASRLFALGGPQVYAASLMDPRLQVAAMRRHARVLLLLTMRIFATGGVVAGWVYVWLTPALGAGLLAFVDDLNLPLIDSFFDAPPEWAVVLAGFIGIGLIGLIAWALVTLGWSALMGVDETTYFRGIKRRLWSRGWFGLGALATVMTVGAAILLWLAYDPLLAMAYVFASSFLTLLCLAVLSSGGSTFAGTEDSQSTKVASTKMTGQESSGLAVAVFIAFILLLVPIGTLALAPAKFGWIVVAEALLLSAILAAEGVREYRQFTKAFNSRNKDLPEPEKGQ